MYTRILQSEPQELETKPQHLIKSLLKALKDNKAQEFIRLIQENHFNVNTPINEKGDILLTHIINIYASHKFSLKLIHFLLTQEPKHHKSNLTWALGDAISLYKSCLHFQENINLYVLLLIKHGADPLNSYVKNNLQAIISLQHAQSFLKGPAVNIPVADILWRLTAKTKENELAKLFLVHMDDALAKKEEMSDIITTIKKEACSQVSDYLPKTRYYRPLEKEISSLISHLHKMKNSPEKHYAQIKELIKDIMDAAIQSLNFNNGHFFHTSLIYLQHLLNKLGIAPYLQQAFAFITNEKITPKTFRLQNHFSQLLENCYFEEEANYFKNILLKKGPKYLYFSDKIHPEEMITHLTRRLADPENKFSQANLKLHIAAQFYSIDINQAIQHYQTLIKENYDQLFSLSREELAAQLFALNEKNPQASEQLLLAQFAQELELVSPCYYVVRRISIALQNIGKFTNDVIHQFLDHYHGMLEAEDHYLESFHGTANYLAVCLTHATGETKNSVAHAISKQFEVELQSQHPNSKNLTLLFNELLKFGVFDSTSELIKIINLARQNHQQKSLLIPFLEKLSDTPNVEHQRLVKQTLVLFYGHSPDRQLLQKAGELIKELPESKELQPVISRYAFEFRSKEHFQQLATSGNLNATLSLANIAQEEKNEDTAILLYQSVMQKSLATERINLIFTVVLTLFKYIERTGAFFTLEQKQLIEKTIQSAYNKLNEKDFLIRHPYYLSTLYKYAVEDSHLKNARPFLPMKGILPILTTFFGENLAFLEYAAKCEPEEKYAAQKESVRLKIQNIPAYLREHKLSLKEKVSYFLTIIEANAPTTTLYNVGLREIANITLDENFSPTDFDPLLTPLIKTNLITLHNDIITSLNKSLNLKNAIVISKLYQFKLEHASSMDEVKFFERKIERINSFLIQHDKPEIAARTGYLPAITLLVSNHPKNSDVNICLSSLLLLLTKNRHAMPAHDIANMKKINCAIFLANKHLQAKNSDPLVQLCFKVINTYDSSVNPLVYLFATITDKICFKRLAEAARGFLHLQNENEWLRWQSTLMHLVSLQRLHPAIAPSAPALPQETGGRFVLLSEMPRPQDSKEIIATEERKRPAVDLEEDEFEPGAPKPHRSGFFSSNTSTEVQEKKSTLILTI